MIKISIIVPGYNVEPYIARCLDSLVNQTLKDIEIIVINDGSKDNTQKIVDEYAKKYPKIIKAFEIENGGLSNARNTGMKYATGEFIGFIDSDDYVKLDMFEKMYSKAKKDNLDIVLSDIIVKSDKGEHVLKSNLELSDDVVKNYIISYPMAWTRIIKKDIMKNFTFKKGIFYEDLHLMPSFVLETTKIGFTNYPSYYYIETPGSIMKQTSFNEKFLDLFDVLENNKQKLFKKYPDEVEYLYITHLLRSATLRFIDFSEGKKYLEKIKAIMTEDFPNWKSNIYYKKSGFKLKLICILAYGRHYTVLKMIKKITGK